MIQRFDDLLSSRVVFGSVLTVERKGQTLEVEVPDNFYKTVATEGRWNFIGTGELVHEVNLVTAGENAEKAGIKSGDKIIGVEGNKINGNNDLPEKLGKVKNGEIHLTIRREGKRNGDSCKCK